MTTICLHKYANTPPHSSLIARPFRGQSGFDNSGRGYYFAGEDSEHRRYPYSKYSYDEGASSSPCGVRAATECPYAYRGGSGGGSSGTTQVTSRPITSQHGYQYGYGVGGGGSESSGSGSSAGAATRHTSASNSSSAGNSQGWNYVDERDKVLGMRGSGRNEDRGRERERGGDRDPQR